MAKARNREESRNISVKVPFGEEAYYRFEKRFLHLQKYMAKFSGYDPKASDPGEAATQDSLFFAEQFGRTNSVIFEPSIEGKGRFHEELEAVVAAAKALFAGFDDLMTRCSRHTDLCVALRALRTEAEAKPKSSFFRVIVDIHDCVRFTGPEDMTKKMASVIGNVVPNLSDSITKEELFSITDKLFDAGLRPWSLPRGDQKKMNSSGK
jgi:hypothetical protein